MFDKSDVSNIRAAVNSAAAGDRAGFDKAVKASAGAGPKIYSYILFGLIGNNSSDYIPLVQKKIDETTDNASNENEIVSELILLCINQNKCTEAVIAALSCGCNVSPNSLVRTAIQSDNLEVYRYIIEETDICNRLNNSYYLPYPINQATIDNVFLRNYAIICSALMGNKRILDYVSESGRIFREDSDYIMTHCTQIAFNLTEASNMFFARKRIDDNVLTVLINNLARCYPYGENAEAAARNIVEHTDITKDRDLLSSTFEIPAVLKLMSQLKLERDDITDILWFDRAMDHIDEYVNTASENAYIAYTVNVMSDQNRERNVLEAFSEAVGRKIVIKLVSGFSAEFITRFSSKFELRTDISLPETQAWIISILEKEKSYKMMNALLSNGLLSEADIIELAAKSSSAHKIYNRLHKHHTEGGIGI